MFAKCCRNKSNRRIEDELLERCSVCNRRHFRKTAGPWRTLRFGKRRVLVPTRAEVEVSSGGFAIVTRDLAQVLVPTKTE